MPNNPAASFDDDSGDAYDDNRMSLHANDGNELSDNLTNILQNNKESEAEEGRLDSVLKNLIQELDKDEKIGEKIDKEFAEIVNKFWKEKFANAFEKFNKKSEITKTSKLYSFNSAKIQ